MLYFFAVLLTFVSALYFDYTHIDVTCFRHKAVAEMDIQLTYTVNTPELYTSGGPSGALKDAPVQLLVYDIYDELVFDTKISDRGELLFSPRQVGDYRICVGGGSIKMDRTVGRMSLSIRNHASTDNLTDSKRRQEEQTITRLLAKAKAIDQQANVIHANFDRFEAQISSTRRTIILSSLLCIGAYIGITAWQTAALRRYFVRMKI